MRVLAGHQLKIIAGNWNYCSEYRGVGPKGLPEFVVTWTALT